MDSNSSEALRELIAGDLRTAAAFWEVGALSSSLLPAIAADALERGQESPWIIRLGALEGDDPDVANFFRSSVDEDDEIFEPRDASALIAGDCIVEAILANKIDPVDGARMLSRLALEAPEDLVDLFGPFRYAASEIDERPEDHEFFIRAIMRAAEGWRESRAVRQKR
ncbi:MAG: hypothetical protein ACREQV_03465 [Candidatus Binatia bacterium]